MEIWFLVFKAFLRKCPGTRGSINTICRGLSPKLHLGHRYHTGSPDVGTYSTLQKGSGLKLLVFSVSLFPPLPPLLTQLS